MHYFKIFTKIVYSYIFTGLFGFGVSLILLYVRDGNLTADRVNPVTSIFAWPVSSFASAQTIFGPQDAQVWHFLSLFSILLFISLVVTSLEKKY